MTPNPNFTLFFYLLMISSLSVITANSWFTMWLALEINTMSFIPLMMSKNINSTETSIKYFLIQVLASSIMMMMIMNFQIMIICSYLIFIPILLKIGAPPMHFWFTNVMQGLNWKNSMVLLTWQKLAPMSMIPLFSIKTMILIMGMISIITGSIGGLNQTSLRKIFTYSSINHMGWMMIVVSLNNMIWFKYLMLYTLITISMILPLKKKMFNIKQMFLSSNIMTSIFMTVNLLSLTGIPPLLGFMPKWMSIQLLLNFKLMILSISMMIMSLPMMFFYMYLIYHNLSIYFLMNPWKFKNTYNIKILMSIAISSSLPLMIYINL
uniref:NADH-ubiquinone oxidoreductase chain 2 n=1 Tax=Eosembia sp. FS-2017 TaxID=2021303 RepID=A0A678RTR3_9NEOP|nr:NADH dehydrogenase subunit 2 [Eosembia sp. FS-2017]